MVPPESTLAPVADLPRPLADAARRRSPDAETLLREAWRRFGTDPAEPVARHGLDTALILAELGLEQEIDWVETQTGVFAEGKLFSVSNTMELLRFPVLGWLDVLRLGGTIFYASRIRDWQRLERIPVAD